MIELFLTRDKNNLAVCELRDGQQVIAKVYAAPDGQTIRLAMPEFRVFSQLRLEPDLHFVDVYRKVEWAAAARERRKAEEARKK